MLIKTFNQLKTYRRRLHLIDRRRKLIVSESVTPNNKPSKLKVQDMPIKVENIFIIYGYFGKIVFIKACQFLIQIVE